MPRPNRRPEVSFKHFRCIGYKAEKICTKAELDEYPPIEQEPIEGFSEFDVSKWPKRSVEFGLGFFFKDRCPQGDIPEKFCLNVEDDIVDLCFVVKETAAKHRTVHLYLCWELERRAWEKYGGPTGLEAARKRLQECFLSYPSPVESCKDGGEQNGESGEEDEAKENDGDSEEEEKEDGGVDGAETPEETVQSQMVRMKHWFLGFTEEQQKVFLKDLPPKSGQPIISSTPKKAASNGSEDRGMTSHLPSPPSSGMKRSRTEAPSRSASPTAPEIRSKRRHTENDSNESGVHNDGN